jgi:hypothetical protein
MAGISGSDAMPAEAVAAMQAELQDVVDIDAAGGPHRLLRGSLREADCLLIPVPRAGQRNEGVRGSSDSSRGLRHTFGT